jgi:hypothetical protein
MFGPVPPVLRAMVAVDRPAGLLGVIVCSSAAASVARGARFAATDRAAPRRTIGAWIIGRHEAPGRNSHSRRPPDEPDPTADIKDSTILLWFGHLVKGA